MKSRKINSLNGSVDPNLEDLKVQKMVSDRFILSQEGVLFEKWENSWEQLPFTKVKDVSISECHVIVATEQGVFCRGSSNYGQCGTSEDTTEFTKISDLTFEVGNSSSFQPARHPNPSTLSFCPKIGKRPTLWNTTVYLSLVFLPK